MIVYRIAKKKYAADLSGAGSMLDGGRWNSAGIPLLYTSASRSLALLEILAHSTAQPKGRVMLTLELPSRVRIHKINLKDLPKGWDEEPPTSTSQSIGDEFIRIAKYLALEVPSVIIEEESNILINPLHPEAQKIKILNVEDLEVDPRLK